MTFEHPGDGALDYFPCRYGKSKLLFRGPRRRLSAPYCAALGGTETYGKFVAEPWPALLERKLGMPVINFGYLNAGVDVFVADPQLIDIAVESRVTVFQLMGPQNLTNRFYAVHPRRNDRFLRASSVMRGLFRDVDFTEFNFTRHMLLALRSRSPDRFGQLADELREAWVARMQMLLDRIGGKVVVLWLDKYRLGGADDPVPIDQAMVDLIRPHATELVHAEPSALALAAGTAGMWLGPLDEPAAAEMPGPQMHAEIAEALLPVLRRMLSVR